MKRFVVICLAALCLGASTGCFFSRKSARKSEGPATVAEMEQNFRHRWIEKLSAELTPGLAQDAAREQAAEEFRMRYGFTSAGRK